MYDAFAESFITTIFGFSPSAMQHVYVKALVFMVLGFIGVSFLRCIIRGIARLSSDFTERGLSAHERHAAKQAAAQAKDDAFIFSPDLGQTRRND